MKNWSYTIEEGEHKGVTLWSGRYCATVAIVFCTINDKICVLANQRGEGTPDYQGKWNCPCGFLEADENARECCSREVFEETGVSISPDKFQLAGVETSPSSKNVSLRYVAVLKEGRDDISISMSSVLNGQGEKNEVASISWIPIDNLDNYEWAFNHRELIPEILNEWKLI